MEERPPATARGGPPAWRLGVGIKPFAVKNKFLIKI
jgi:hypothetical protein